MPSLISHLSKKDQQALLDDLNYLNSAEIKAFCKRHDIPFTISIETTTGIRKTNDDDRKGVILGRIRYYLNTGKVRPPTCFPSSVLPSASPSADLRETDRLFYGHYDKKNPVMLKLLKDLTGEQFKDGAIARILANEFWSKGQAPTYREFAAAWREARVTHTRPNPEWAFLSDRSAKKETTGWKKLRAAKAKHVLKILSALVPNH